RVGLREAPHDRGGAVGGAVVDDDELDRPRVVEAGEAGQRARQPRLLVVGRQDDRHRGGGGGGAPRGRRGVRAPARLVGQEHAPDHPRLGRHQRHGQEHEDDGEHLDHDEPGSGAAVAASLSGAREPRYARLLMRDDVLEPAETAGDRSGRAAGPEGVASFHALLTSLPGYEDQVAAYHFFPPRRGAVVDGYDGPYASELARLGIAPYAHQARALAALGGGEDVVIATPTASGKSLVFQVPLAAAVAGGGTGVVLYPTKALAHDQLGRLRALYAALREPGGPEPEAAIATYDGDTATERRAAVREGVRVALTNPDMLHYGVLPYHDRWAVVLSELHAYRGLLGPHVANVVRRLLRLAERYGARPRVVCASATVGNAGEHAARLTCRSFAVVAEDDAPAAARELVIWRPRATQDGRRRSANSEAAELAAAFAARGIRSLFFCNSRKAAELVRRNAVQQLPAELESAVGSYRAGYTAVDRREHERAFRAGEVTVLTTTSA